MVFTWLPATFILCCDVIFHSVACARGQGGFTLGGDASIVLQVPALLNSAVWSCLLAICKLVWKRWDLGSAAARLTVGELLSVDVLSVLGKQQVVFGEP